MHEVLHRWSDGYGASLTFTYLPNPSASTPYVYVTFDGDERADVFADATDLRAIAAAALAAAEALSTEGS